MPTAVSVGETSHVVVYFTSTWSGFRARTALVLTLQIEGDGFSASSPDLIDRGGTGHAGGTVMWAFDGVAPGDYTVRATARLAGRLDAHEGANLQGCALTVLVTPAVE
jgi:hypothetical protein